MHSECVDIDPQYAGGSCDAACPPVVCECGTASQTFTLCNARLGCLTALDCAAACERIVPEVERCVLNGPCVDDADCPYGRCARYAHETKGECTSADEHGICLEDADCLIGPCVGASRATWASCSALQVDDRCDPESGCDEGLHCVINSGNNGDEGVCQDGGIGARCNQSEDCDAPLRCLAGQFTYTTCQE